MGTHRTAVGDKKTNHKRPLEYDPRAEVVRDVHLPLVTGLSSTTLWRYDKAGDFVPAIRLGPNSKGRFRSDVLAWLESRKER